MRLLVATGNRGKLSEVRQLCGEVALELVSLADVGVEAPEETGATFAENAALKACAGARASGLWALGDDSGLCVEALGGRPGLHSARYDTTEERRRAKLLAELAAFPTGKRAAFFRCDLALARPDGTLVQAASGECSGAIALAARGTNGFGYDPLFELHDGRTMAELTDAEKHAVSHRGRAFETMREVLRRLAADDLA